jgi:hypothetical protein
MTAESSPSVLKTSPSVYDDLEPRLQDDLRVRADRIRQTLVRTTGAVIEAGRDLLAAKDQLDHGQFRAWIESEFRMNIRTAQQYMSVARLAEGSKNEIVSFLSPTTARLLARKSTPTEVRDKVLELTADGKPLSDDDVRDLVRDAQHQKKIAAAEARLTPAQRQRRKHSARRAAEQGEEWEQERERRRQEVAARAKAIIGRFAPDDLAFLMKMLNDIDIWELRNSLSERVQAGLGDQAPSARQAPDVELDPLDAIAAPDLAPTTPPEGKLTWSTPSLSEIDPADAGLTNGVAQGSDALPVSEAVQPLAEDGCAIPDIPAFLRRTPPSSVAPGDSPAVSPAPPARAATREAAE